MSRIWRSVTALCALLATGLNACSWFTIGGGGPAYGVVPAYGAIPAYGPSPIALEIRSFTNSPAGSVHTGDSLTFYADIEPADNVQAWVTLAPGTQGFTVMLHDDGVAPDQAAADHVYSGSGLVAEAQAGDHTANLQAYAYKNGQYAIGTDQLTIRIDP